MMSPPATIQILHMKFEFRLVDEVFFDAAACYGFCDKKHLVIAVLKNLRPALLADCTIHEVLHGIHFVMGCDETLTEEQMAMQLAGPLCLLIRDNKQLFDWLQSLLNPEDVEDGAYQ